MGVLVVNFHPPPAVVGYIISHFDLLFLVVNGSKLNTSFQMLLQAVLLVAKDVETGHQRNP